MGNRKANFQKLLQQCFKDVTLFLSLTNIVKAQTGEIRQRKSAEKHA